IGFALAHAEQASLDHLEGIGLEVDQNEEQAIFRRRERTVFVHREPAGGPRFPIEAPRGKTRMERGLKGRDEALKLVERHAGEIEELCRAGLHIGELDTGHTWCLLSWEAQYTIIGINSIASKSRGKICPGTHTCHGTGCHGFRGSSSRRPCKTAAARD